MNPLYSYQEAAVQFAHDRLVVENQKGVGLLLDCGYGKTRITLEILRRIREGLFTSLPPVWVVAPLQVIYSVWPVELKLWRFPFTFRIVHGNVNQRIRAMRMPADLYFTNYENLTWLSQQPLPSRIFWVFDESPRLKNWTAKRTQAVRRMLARKGAGNCRDKRLILTGTPAPNSLADMFSQVFVLDDGEALGETLSRFRNRFCFQGGYLGRQHIFNQRLAGVVNDAIAPLVMRLDKADHLDLPECLHNWIRVDLEGDALQQYRSMEDDLFADLASGETLTASSAGAKYMMCRGIANGGAYERDVFGELTCTHDLHEIKAERAVSIVDELNGKPVIICFQFKHDIPRIQRCLKRAGFGQAPVIEGGQKAQDRKTILDNWNAGEIQVLLVQPQACSFGVNLQSGGNDLIWVGLTDQLEIYLQMNDRLHRQGVKGAVRIHHIICRDTIDEAMRARLQSKNRAQTTMLQALKEYRSGLRPSSAATNSLTAVG